MMEQHTASKHTYYRVWGILIALLLITAGVSYLDLGPLNIVVSSAVSFATRTGGSFTSIRIVFPLRSTPL